MLYLRPRALFAILAVAGSASADSNLVVNGSFEDNTAGGTLFNLSNAAFNAAMPSVTAFGAAQEVDIMLGDGGYGPSAIDGKYKIALHHQRPPGTDTDAIAMSLTQPLIGGGLYHLSFAAAAVLAFDAGVGPFSVGISSDPASFGTQVFSVNAVSADAWGQYAADIASPVDGVAYLTFSVPGTSTWVQLDAVSLTAIPAPAAAPFLGIAGLAFSRRRR